MVELLWRPLADLPGTEDDVLAFKQRPTTGGPAPIVCTVTRDNAIELCIFAGR